MACADLSIEYGIRGYPECSGHGVCVPGHGCVCDMGWSGYSDFELVDGIDCDINLTLIQVWGAINLTLTIIVCVVILWILVIHEKFLFIKSLKHIQRIYSSDRAMVFIFYFIANVFGILASIPRIFSPRSAVLGKEWHFDLWFLGIVVSFTYGTTSFFKVLVLFLQNMSKFCDKTTQSTVEKNSKQLELFTIQTPRLCFIVLITTIILVHSLPPSAADKISIAVCLLLVIGYGFYSFSLLRVLDLFLKELKKYLSTTCQPRRKSLLNTLSNSMIINSPNATSKAPLQSLSDKGSLSTPSPNNHGIQRIYDKILFTYHMFLPSIIGVPLNLAFAVWIFLRRKIVYLFLIEMSTIAILAVCVVWALSTVTKQETPYHSSGKFKLAMVKHVNVKTLQIVKAAKVSAKQNMDDASGFVV